MGYLKRSRTDADGGKLFVIRFVIYDTTSAGIANYVFAVSTAAEKFILRLLNMNLDTRYVDYLSEVEHLVKMYKEHKAVNDISFSVKEGEFFAFLGENGAGKSTTINIPNFRREFRLFATYFRPAVSQYYSAGHC